MATYQFDFTVVTDGEDEAEALEEAMQLLADYRFAKEAATVTVLEEATCVLTPENIGTEDDCTTHEHVYSPGPNSPDSPRRRVAALSADLRSIIEANDADEYGDSEAEANCARDLLDAIDAMLEGD